MGAASEQKKFNNLKEIPGKKPEKISIKENPKLEKLRAAPEEVVARAIREMIRKDGGEG